MPDKRKALLGLGLGLGSLFLILWAVTRKVKAAPPPPPPPPPPGLATLYGVVTNATTDASLAGALINLSGYPRYTNGTGGFLFQNLTPGQYPISVSLAGYQTKAWNIMVAEGINQLDIALYPVAPTGLVSIDKFEVQCDFASTIIRVRLTLTNHTAETFIDQTPTGAYGGLVVQAGADAYKAPAIDFADYMGDVFLMRPWNRYGIGNLPPGITVLTSEINKAAEGQPWFFSARNIGEGSSGYSYTWFRAMDEKPPATIFAAAEGFFRGIFSSSWQTWTKTSWTPPPPPEIPVVQPPEF